MTRTSPGRLPSLNGLRTFEAIARHQSVTRAAQELNVTQTAVSHQLRRLEAAGVRRVDPQQGIFFESGHLAIQAAVEGVGVAIGRTASAADDLEAGRLVAPFDVRMRRRAYYFVVPEPIAAAPKIVRFREWLIAQVCEVGPGPADVEKRPRKVRRR